VFLVLRTQVKIYVCDVVSECVDTWQAEKFACGGNRTRDLWLYICRLHNIGTNEKLHAYPKTIFIFSQLIFPVVQVIFCPYSDVQSKADVVISTKMASNQKTRGGTF
jgi:hypothetical protein